MRSYEATLESPEELAAVNDMLAAIGESPVNSLEGDANADVANARRILNNVNREVQAKGWTYNITTDEQLLPDTFSGFIPYMSDYLRLTAQGGTPYVRRGEHVYDKTNRTDVFTSPITVDLIRLKDYSEMPECFRAWIVVKASRRFNMFFFGAGEIEGHLQTLEEEHYRACMEYELDFGEFNMLDGDVFVQGKINR
ncbi:tail protein [Pseudomonas phage vB_PpuP-Vasula]